MSTTHLTITAAEEPRLLHVMKDIQETVATYHVETARRGDLGAQVRTWLTRVQNLNDLLTEQLGDRATYRALFATPGSAGAELINAVKYARNVDQHRDVRVVTGQVTKDGTAYLVGFTFVDQLSFSPFVETVEQVEQDIDSGYPYIQGDVEANTDQVADRFPGAQGGVFHSPKDVTTWATRLTRTTYDSDWVASFDSGWWEHMITLEQPGLLPDFVAYHTRRARRLNALGPPR